MHCYLLKACSCGSPAHATPSYFLSSKLSSSLLLVTECQQSGICRKFECKNKSSIASGMDWIKGKSAVKNAGMSLIDSYILIVSDKRNCCWTIRGDKLVDDTKFRRFALFYLSVKTNLTHAFVCHKQYKLEILIEVYFWNTQEINTCVNYVQHQINVSITDIWTTSSPNLCLRQFGRNFGNSVKNMRNLISSLWWPWTLASSEKKYHA
jgi:hypothetical protein